MDRALIIGNKPYINFQLNNIIDSFDVNYRCNMTYPGRNNGTKFDNLGLCIHLYENLVSKKCSKSEFREIYNANYKKEEVNKFLEEFDKHQYKNIYYSDNFQKNTNRFNLLLKEYGCTIRFNKMPRTGYTALFDNLLKENKVFVTNFSIYDEERVTYYVKKEKYENNHVHSKDNEIAILRWLHINEKIDASLCLLEDDKEPILNCSTFNPSEVIINKILKEHNKCTLKDYKGGEDSELLNSFQDYNINFIDGNVYIAEKKT